MKNRDVAALFFGVALLVAPALEEATFASDANGPASKAAAATKGKTGFVLASNSRSRGGAGTAGARPGGATRPSPSARTSGPSSSRHATAGRQPQQARSSSGGRSTAARQPHGGSPTRVAQGHATYGYGYGSGYGDWWWPYYPYWPYDPYGWWAGGCWDCWWYDPHFSVGIGWYPGPYYVSTQVLAPGDGERDIPAVVETDVRPKKATLRLDGENIGEAGDYSGTWDRLLLSPGKHLIEFELSGYQTLRIELHARPGRTYLIQEELAKGGQLEARSIRIGDEIPTPAQPPSELISDSSSGTKLRRGLLRIEAEPADAAVYLDGQLLGSAEELLRLHGALPVAEGPHRIEVVRPGCEAEARPAEVGSEAPLRVVIRLMCEGRP